MSRQGIAALFFCFILAGPAGANQAVSYSRDIQPILAENCYHCHGPDGKAREADLRLDTKEGAYRTLDGITALGFIAAGPWDLIGHAEVGEHLHQHQRKAPGNGRASGRQRHAHGSSRRQMPCCQFYCPHGMLVRYQPALLPLPQPQQAEQHLAELERICGNRSCEEYQDLAEAIADSSHT